MLLLARMRRRKNLKAIVEILRMSWLTNFVRPKIQSAKKIETPDNLWDKCPSCKQMVFHRDLQSNLFVCPACQYHWRIGFKLRLEKLFDQGQYQRKSLPKFEADPLKFRDQKKYADRLKEYQTKSGENDALVVAEGTVGGHRLVVAIFNFSFMGGSMGIAVGEGLLAAADAAVASKAALLAVPASGGARMQEGILSLMQMPRSVIAVEKVKNAGLPYLVLLTDPTTGGVSASFAMLGDITMAEPGSIIGFAGARVIEETIREKLPEGFQRAEYLQEHGMVDLVVHRHEIPKTVAKILSHLNPVRTTE